MIERDVYKVVRRIWAMIPVLMAMTALAGPADFTCSDPFIVRDDAAGVYRLYHNVGVKNPGDPYVLMRTSKDLLDWSEPKGVLNLPAELDCSSIWAPEVHEWKGKWYMFASIHKRVNPKKLLETMVPGFNPQRRKTYLATWTFVADNPAGPFRRFAEHAITPENWSSLDGTLFEEDGKPYMVFCHEWTQLRDGTIDAVEMSTDLSHAVGKPFTLFKASDLRTVVEGKPQAVPSGVTDGPFLFRTKTGKLLMLWSSAYDGYIQAVSHSESGRLAGPWKKHEIIRRSDSGHGMVFKTFDGRLAIALHSPNTPHLDKRLRVFELEDTGDTLKIGKQIGGIMENTGVIRMPQAPSMKSLSLNGLWDFRFEKGKSLEDLQLPRFEANDKMTVPGCWDSMSKYYNQRGTGLYRTSFILTESVRDAFLVVDGCGLRSKYWIDGRLVGFSKLPWSKFEFRIGWLPPGRHEIVAAVDSIVDNSKVKLFWDFYDFYPFGGFHHGIRLDLQTRPDEIRRVVARTRDYRTGKVELEAQFAGGNGPKEFKAMVAFNDGELFPVQFRNRRATLNVPMFRLWSPSAPNLTTVKVVVNGVAAKTRFGIRQVGTEKGRITLNGERVYLKGVNRHESHYEFGVTTPSQLVYEDIQNAKSMGCNFIRGSHYAQSEEFLSMCDELGVMVWEESLGWGNVAKQLSDPEFCDLQAEETRLMVRNSINHPCIIISAFLNEPSSELPVCKKLVDRLIDVIKAEDSGHLVTFACHRNLNDISHARTDIIAYNTYPCWYSHELQNGSNEEIHQNIRQCHDEIVKRFRGMYKDERPIIVSETGVKADYGARDPRGGAQYTEDFQAEYEKAMLEEIFANKEIGGVAIWQFTDAKTYTRTRGLRNRSYGVNTGGLYDLYRRPKLVVDEIRKLYTAKPEKEPLDTVPSKSPVNVIFDTDMYTDYDDVGAMAMLHAMADAGECRIIAVGCNTWGDGNQSVAACEVINAYYGRQDIPMGCARSGGRTGEGAKGHGLPAKYPQWVKHPVSTDAPLAVDVYLQELRKVPDKSVVLCSVGFLNNVADLLKADRELVSRKVKEWVCMACSYPNGKEYNSRYDAAASDYAFRNWPKDIPIIWTDFQYGRTCYAGRVVAELPDDGNPIRDAFASRLLARDKVVPCKSWDQMEGHPSWDQTAVLIAVRGWEPFFNLERGRYEMVGNDGEDRWIADVGSNCGRVTEKLTKKEVGRILDELMLRKPMRLQTSKVAK